MVQAPGDNPASCRKISYLAFGFIVDPIRVRSSLLRYASHKCVDLFSIAASEEDIQLIQVVIPSYTQHQPLTWNMTSFRTSTKGEGKDYSTFFFFLRRQPSFPGSVMLIN